MRKTTTEINKLTEKQESVVASLSYPQYLRAAAGTGKTEVLIQKIIQILINNPSASLKDFGIVTFTNKATDEMKNRLRNSLYSSWLKLSKENKDLAEKVRVQAEIVSMADISTIHGFCESLLRQYGLSIGLPLDFKVKSFKHQSSIIINQIVDARYDSHLLKNIPIYRITKLLSTVLNESDNRGIQINRALINSFVFDMEDNDYWNEFKPLFLSMLLSASKKIEKAKNLDGILTLNDLIGKTVLLLQNEYIIKQVSKRYKYLFIDEFQDTNIDQFNLVRLLIGHGVKVFLVGDDKQSVYSFRGADIENSKEMSNYVLSLSENKNQIALDENFRSDEKLINAINEIFSRKFFYDGMEISFPTVPLVVPEINMGTGLKSPVEQVYSANIPQTIESALDITINGRKATYGDIAILCRRNFDLDKIGSELRSLGYPVEIVGGKGFFRSKEVIDTYKLFNAVLYHGIEHMNELRFTDYYTALLDNEKTDYFHEFFNNLSVAFRIETIESLFVLIFSETRILEYYREKKNYQALYNLLKLRDKARELMNAEALQPIQFLDYLRIMITTRHDEDDAEIPEKERAFGVIKLYSIHKAKGLSFPIVIVPCLDNKLNRPITKPKVIFDVKSDPPELAFDNEALHTELSFDRNYANLLMQNQLKQLEEEIRIFYVACTRAKHKLILASSKSKYEIHKTLKWKEYASIAKWLVCGEDKNEF